MMPAGRYYVGDLCYVIEDETWDECCNLFFDGPSGCSNEGEFTLKDGRHFASYSTAYGDGEYRSNVGTSHGVDSGSIGCILVSDVRDQSEEEMRNLGAIIEFREPFETQYENGVIVFGHVRIDTDPSDPHEEEQTEEDWDD